MERFDEFYFTIAKETGGIEGVLSSMFSFLLRRTDFYYESDPGDKMGFPPGVSFRMVATQFQRYQSEHYKKHPQKSQEEYQQKLQKYKQQESKPQQKVEAEKEKQPVQQEAKQPTKAEIQSIEKQTQIKENKAQSDFSTYNGGITDKYTWSQSGNDVTVNIDLPTLITKKDIIVQITNTELKVQIKNQPEPIISGKLYDRVKQDDSMWSIIDNKKLSITLEKATENIWKTVIQGDTEIDATKVENSKPLEDFDPETQGALRKIMYEQQRKNQGLPTTEEEKQQEMLQKAWNAEGSPFKGQPFDPSKFNLQGSQFNI